MFKNLRLTLAEKLLRGTDFIPYNKNYYKAIREHLTPVDTTDNVVVKTSLIERYGAENAIVLTALINKEVVDGELFPYTHSRMRLDTGLPQLKQDKAIRCFIRKGIIEQVNTGTKGRPNARHFRFKRVEW